jgi:hypothetical protein
LPEVAQLWKRTELFFLGYFFFHLHPPFLSCFYEKNKKRESISGTHLPQPPMLQDFPLIPPCPTTNSLHFREIQNSFFEKSLQSINFHRNGMTFRNTYYLLQTFDTHEALSE